MMEQQTQASRASDTSTTQQSTTCPTSDYLAGVAIGEGRFGRVLHAQHKSTKHDVAIKVIDKASVRKHPWLGASLWAEQQLLQEAALQESQWIVNLWAAFHDTECVYLVMECVMGGTLRQLIDYHLGQPRDNNNGLSWSTTGAPYYGQQLALAVEFLHDHGIVHGDVKPENALLTPQGLLQLSDFGSAFRICNTMEKGNDDGDDDGDDTASAVISGDNTRRGNPQQNLRGESFGGAAGGTVDYSSPEEIRGTPREKLTTGIDLWSVGCVFVALQWGESPFHAPSDALAVRKIMEYVENREDGTSHERNSTHTQKTGAKGLSGGTSSRLLLERLLEDENQQKATSENIYGLPVLPDGWRNMILGLLNPIPSRRLLVSVVENDETQQQEHQRLSKLVPEYEFTDVRHQEPAFLPPTPQWLQASKTEPMRDGKQGWSAFAL